MQTAPPSLGGWTQWGQQTDQTRAQGIEPRRWSSYTAPHASPSSKAPRTALWKRRKEHSHHPCRHVDEYAADWSKWVWDHCLMTPRGGVKMIRKERIIFLEPSQHPLHYDGRCVNLSWDSSCCRSYLIQHIKILASPSVIDRGYNIYTYNTKYRIFFLQTNHKGISILTRMKTDYLRYFLTLRLHSDQFQWCADTARGCAPVEQSVTR